MPPANVFRHLLRITYADCTVGNHVYYARYFDFLEAARGEFFRSLGFSFQDLEDQGFAFPVIRCEANFKRAARYDDVIQIELWLHSIQRIRLDFAYRIISEGNETLFDARTSLACTDLQGKILKPPPDLVDKLTPYRES